MSMLDVVPQSASGVAHAGTNLSALEPSGRGVANAAIAPTVGEAVTPATRS
jgi:hypothetical protein